MNRELDQIITEVRRARAAILADNDNLSDDRERGQMRRGILDQFELLERRIRDILNDGDQVHG